MTNCYKIYVDCQENDPVDIKCGGPEYLGYDFFVEESEVEEMIKFIKETCKELNVPIINVYYDSYKFNSKDPDNVWTKDEIYKCIEDNEAGLNLSSDCSL